MAADLHKFLFKSKFMRKIENLNFVFISVLCLLLVISAAKDCKDLCKNGSCSEDGVDCICNPGWAGLHCEYCSGRVRLWNASGVISDGPGNYSEDNQCTWLIDPEKSNSSIRLYLSHFATECSWDHLYIYDGGSIYDPLLAVFSGMVVQDNYKISNTHELIAHSGKALLHFYSDAAYNLTGFSIKYRVDGCPSSIPDTDCSNKGVCIEGKCTCDGGWTGPSCSIQICPNNCSSNGRCLMEQHRCVCHAGYTGNDCGQKVDSGWWDYVQWSESLKSTAENLNEMASEQVLERASHSVIVIDDVAWVMGGYSFKNIPFLVLYNISDNAVQVINSPSKKTPSARYGHSAVAYNDSIYMYGGMLEDGRQSSELWRFRPSSLIWDLVTDIHMEGMLSPFSDEAESVRKIRSDKNGHRLQGVQEKRKKKITQRDKNCPSAVELCSPFATTGHSAVVVRNRFMLILLGYSSRYGSMNIVQEFYFDSNMWKVVETYGALVDGTYGHSAVWDPQSLLVFVHGGLKTSYVNSVVSDLVSYDPFKHKWFTMEPSPIPRFLHSSVLLPGLIVTFGGNTHNDTAYSYGAKCYSSDTYVYDIICKTWTKLTHIPELGVESARYGHSAVLWRDTMLILGGFNGRMLGSVLRYHLGRCEKFDNAKDCQSSYPGRKCAWNLLLNICESVPPGETPHGFCSKKKSRTKELLSAICSREPTCYSCVHNSNDCQWCGTECAHKCSNHAYDFRKKLIDGSVDCGNRRFEWCKKMTTCEMCLANRPLCSWVNKACVFIVNSTSVSTPVSSNDVTAKSPKKTEKWTQNRRQVYKQSATPANQTSTSVIDDSGNLCVVGCTERVSCLNCTQGPCMWCFNEQRCVSNDSYLISFPYGQCREWTTDSRKCVHSERGVSKCMSHQTCESCQGDVSCGWCADTSGTGTGVCLEGGQKGPVNPITKESQSRRCPRKRWYFTSCPSCSCNGHSHCVNESLCVQPCANNTVGVHCDTCRQTYYGNPINGGICKPCQCNGHGMTCEHDTGKCHCDTKGVTGDRCERCDTQNNYYGVPKQGGTCFYDLQIDYQFTFNLSKQEDLHIRQINFYNIPSKPDVDTDFDIQCSKEARIMISAKTGQPEVWIMQNFTGKGLRRRFSASDYVFGSHENNTTFHVYVFNFVPPIEIIISFSQHPKLDLIQFFSIFSLCFMILLFMAFVLWKIKQKYDLYTRRQRLVEEMEAMASRPFQTIVLELQRLDKQSSKLPESTSEPMPNEVRQFAQIKPDYTPIHEFLNGCNNCNGTSNLHADMLQSTPSADTKLDGASPVALEPCAGNKAAVLSLIIQLPNGGARYTPAGHPGGLAVASTLVTLGSPRKSSTDMPSLAKEIPKCKQAKGKKVYENNHGTSL